MPTFSKVAIIITILLVGLFFLYEKFIKIEVEPKTPVITLDEHTATQKGDGVLGILSDKVRVLLIADTTFTVDDHNTILTALQLVPSKSLLVKGQELTFDAKDYRIKVYGVRITPTMNYQPVLEGRITKIKKI